MKHKKKTVKQLRGEIERMLDALYDLKVFCEDTLRHFGYTYRVEHHIIGRGGLVVHHKSVGEKTLKAKYGKVGSR